MPPTAATRNRILAYSRVEGLPLHPGHGLGFFPAFQQALPPLETAEAKEPTAVPPTAPEPAPVGAEDGQAPKPDVLVVEDDDDEVRIISRALRRHGMTSRFKIVRSGEAALDYLGEEEKGAEHHAESRPKVILLDLKLTGIGGREVLRRIRAHDDLCTIPVVILSSTSSAEDLCECYRLGANSFVPKPAASDRPGEHVLEIARYWLELNRPAADA